MFSDNPGDLTRSSGVARQFPSYIRLAWKLSEGAIKEVANSDAIRDFEVLTGLIEEGEEDHQFEGGNQWPYPVNSIWKKQENFEVMQRWWISISNEYLDMFSHVDFLGDQIANPWFADEIDSSYTEERQRFLWDMIIGDDSSKGYKNCFKLKYETCSSYAEITDDNSVFGRDPNVPRALMPSPAMKDNDLLEQPAYPNIKEPAEEITLILNSRFSNNVARSGVASSGNILGMQSRVRNIIYNDEYLLSLSDGTKEKKFDIIRQALASADAPPPGPLEQILMTSNPYLVETFDSAAQADMSHPKLVGFVIEKEQIKNANTDEETSEKFPLMFLSCDSVSATNELGFIPIRYVDAAINYGVVYRYTIKSVYHLEITIPDGGDQSHKFKYFVNSPHSSVLRLETKEINPPSYPRDLDGFYDFNTEEFVFHWAFPVSSQRDTTYFAIFRRKSIYEPFQLLQVNDFNYSLSPGDSISELKIVLDRPFDMGDRLEGDDRPRAGYDITSKVKRMGPDDSFASYGDNIEANTDYIYAVCSIDAHGQMSNYSSQVEVRLDSRTNKLSLKEVSPPGAPLVFPNWFLKTKVFQDVARASRYRKARILFRPEYKKVKKGPDADSRTIDIVKGTREEDGGNSQNHYFIQILNSDRANDVVLKYQVDDTYRTAGSEEDLLEVAKQLGVTKRQLGRE